jgi:hypothetical protein
MQLPGQIGQRPQWVERVHIHARAIGRKATEIATARQDDQPNVREHDDWVGPAETDQCLRRRERESQRRRTRYGVRCETADVTAPGKFVLGQSVTQYG